MGESVCRRFFNDFEVVRQDEGFDEVLTARIPEDVAAIIDILVRQTKSSPHPGPSSPLAPPAPPPPVTKDFSHLFADPHKGPYDLDSSAPILLFDLNGTLTSLTDQRRLKGTKLRPGVERLKELKDAGFRLGIYTSAMTRTVKESKDLIESACGDSELFEPGLILHRDHTKPLPSEQADVEVESEDPSLKRKRRNHDTVKPLEPYFSKLNQVLLFDDDGHKSCQGEERNFCLVPRWESDDDMSCTTLSMLVDALLDSRIVRQPDIREHSDFIRDRIQRKVHEPTFYEFNQP